MEKKNISIYWLIDKIITKKHPDSELNDIFNQAKAMHKKEIVDSYIEGHSIYGENTNAEQYYTETFGVETE